MIQVVLIVLALFYIANVWSLAPKPKTAAPVKSERLWPYVLFLLAVVVFGH
jgi:hypothetical protein